MKQNSSFPWRQQQQINSPQKEQKQKLSALDQLQQILQCFELSLLLPDSSRQVIQSYLKEILTTTIPNYHLYQQYDDPEDDNDSYQTD